MPDRKTVAVYERYKRPKCSWDVRYFLLFLNLHYDIRDSYIISRMSGPISVSGEGRRLFAETHLAKARRQKGKPAFWDFTKDETRGIHGGYHVYLFCIKGKEFL